MGLFRKPFKKSSVDDFVDVWAPVGQAPRHIDSTKAQAASDKPDNGSVESLQSVATDSGLLRVRSVEYDPHSIEGLKMEVAKATATCGRVTPYELKSTVINIAIEDIGMGRYQWELFTMAGFGWFSDNLWLQGVAIVLPSLSDQFDIPATTVRYTTSALFAGLCIGSSFWGFGSDIMGRRAAFNTTLFLTGIFGLAIPSSPSWFGVCGLLAALGTGVGGSLPVDGALFLEWLPAQNGGLLTFLSIWWPFGQLTASLIGWAFLWKGNSEGWKHFIYTLAAITIVLSLIRTLGFHLYESPKYLLSRGRQAEAVAAVHGVAFRNGTKTWLNEEILNDIGGHPETVSQETVSFLQVIKGQLTSFSMDRVKPLFANKRLGVTTLLIWFCWTTIGMGYPLFNAFLPQYLSQSHGSGGASISPYEIYRNYAITSVVGVPGSIIACYTVDIPFIGRKGTMAISTLLSGVFLFMFTLSTDSNFQLAFSSLASFTQNIMYGVLYAYTPEVFPAPNRGTGSGIASCLNRIAGLMGPVIAANVNGSNSPIWISGSLILSAFVAMCLLPIETRGRQRL